MNIDTLFDNHNQHKFSYLLLVKENIDFATYKFLQEKLSEKINVVPIRASKFSLEEKIQAVGKANFVVTGLGETLDVCVKLETPTLCDIASGIQDKSYPTFINFYDPYRNEESKPYYQSKDLDLLLKEIYKQLDRYKIDYVNFM